MEILHVFIKKHSSDEGLCGQEPCAKIQKPSPASWMQQGPRPYSGTGRPWDSLGVRAQAL